MNVAVVAACAAAMVPASLRWLRIAQREHYLAGSVVRFALRWWLASRLGAVMATVAAAATVATAWWVAAGFVVAVVAAIGPPGLGWRGRTSPLAWTARLRRLAGALGLLVVAGGVAGLVFHPLITVALVLLLPGAMDLLLALLGPIETRLGRPWVEKAAAALKASGASVVAITGSYGKTSTKGYVAQLLGGVRRVVASPASFNNRMGLARAINENLGGGVDVFVAEMGTYGPGEIAELCSWIPPHVAVITAVGPVHLERFGSEDRIVAAKSEILTRAQSAVINVDDPRLAAVADAEAWRRNVIRVGTQEGDVVVSPAGSVHVHGDLMGSAPGSVHPTNLACAVGVAVALGVEPTEISGRLTTLTEPPHRRSVTRGAAGAIIVDDTFNANPAGAAAALATLSGLEVTGRRVVVTPGMVELGSRQFEENRAFAAAAAQVADVVIGVGRTNRRALVAGGRTGPAELLVMATREDAVAWVRQNLGPGDAVLYENDLPDHFP
ncbi:MAG TPA: Mur ligase family protein [Acidimicrobiia bacterium]|nr:Mur ligase family protein [Acidimicrobiia bacterium]